MRKGFICASTSSAASPVLFVKKPGGGLRFCVDYRKLNAITIKDRYPIPLIQETLNRLSQACWFSKFDVIAAFNKMRIQEGEEWKTAFKTLYGLYEYLVMPFGLANGPSSFQHFINDTLQGYLDIFVTAYIDDILVYSNSLPEHKIHVKLVLDRLSLAGLQLDISKSEFHVQEVTFLGLLVGKDGIQMDPKKIEALKEWEQPRSVRNIQSIIGFANFYRRFIKDFSKVIQPMMELTRKNTPFLWSSDCNSAFQQLKEAFVTAPILIKFDPDKQIVVEKDASDYVTGEVMSQYDDSNTLRPVAYFSKKTLPLSAIMKFMTRN